MEISERNPSTFDAVQEILQKNAETVQTVVENMCMSDEDREPLEKRRKEDMKKREELAERLAEERKIEA